MWGGPCGEDQLREASLYLCGRQPPYAGCTGFNRRSSWAWSGLARAPWA